MKKIIAALFVLLTLYTASFAGQISPKLNSKLKLLSVSEKITAIVYMKDQPDVSALKGKTEEKVAELDAFSKKMQKDVADYLEKERKNKKVDAFKRFWVFNGFALSADRDVIEKIAKRPDVDRVEYNSPVFLPPQPEKEITPLAVKYLADAAEPNIVQIKADQVWAGYAIRGAGVKVGVVDSGVLATHPDLSSRISLEANFDDAGNKISNSAPDTGGHGTHVAGIVAGGNNSGKYIGVAPGSSLLIAKVFNGDDSTFARAVAGVQWAIDNGAKIINLSFGTTAGDADSDWKNVVDTWTGIGIVVISAIGNFGPTSNTTTSPGNTPNAIGIGAVDSSDTITSFSSRGPIVWSGTTYIKPDVCAPGSAIKSAAIDGTYTNMSGTSMACPHAAGVAALILEANGSLSPSRVKGIMQESALRLPDTPSSPNNNYGYGRIDALAAVNKARNPDVTPPVITHSPVTSAIYSTDMPVTASITDESTLVPTGKVYYKNYLNEWKSVTLEAPSGSSVYTCSIPGSDVISNIDYFIEAYDFAGNMAVSPAGAPASFYTAALAARSDLSLSNNQTCPNPFTPSAGSMTVSYYLSKPADVTARFFTSLGELVKVFSASGTVGLNTFTWDGIQDNGELVSNGVYLYQISARDTSGGISTVKGKVIVLK